MKIVIETIPHDQQRYPTVGDWQATPDGYIIRVSKMSDERYCALVAVHELCELLMCKQHNVSEKAVDEFDMNFEDNHKDDDFEPGDDPNAPYNLEHCVATGIERILAAELGVPWALYEKEIEALS